MRLRATAPSPPLVAPLLTVVLFSPFAVLHGTDAPLFDVDNPLAPRMPEAS